MASPVVHFEILWPDADAAGKFYGDLFGWKVDTNNPINYGMVDNGGKGINGGVASMDGLTHAVFYVEVPDPQATLDKAVAMGAKVVKPVTEVPGVVTYAHIEDPQGCRIGIVKAEA